jgi:hypothetical protein
MALAMSNDPNAAVIAEAIKLAFERNVEAAAQKLESPGDPAEVALRYSDAAQAIYNERKDVSKMLALGGKAVDYSLRKATELAASDPDKSKKLKEIAKVMTFNLAANTWPGWDEPGVLITTEHIKQGLGFAETSKQLVEELRFGPDQVGIVYWMIGAQNLACGRAGEAHAALRRAKSAFAEADDYDSVAMIRGYCALVDKIDPTKRNEATAELDRVDAELDKSGSDNAQFYKGQLETADKVFAKSST